ncbi:MAG: PaaI family thioesterase [Candidatus Promineifilaceae bacterium]
MNNDEILKGLNAIGQGHLPGLMGIEILAVEEGSLLSRLPVRPELMAPNGYLHAGTVTTLADTTSGYGTMANLPDGAFGFTTIELKCNFLGSIQEGMLYCRATPVHLGRTTQVWDARVYIEERDKTLAMFRCTQMLLYPETGK